MRRPRFTRVSDGKPLRRLLVISKKRAVLIERLICHTASGLWFVVLERRRTHVAEDWSGSRDLHPNRRVHNAKCCYYTTILI